MPAKSTPRETLVSGLELALKAAQAYEPLNRGDQPHAELVISLLTDCLAHTALMEELAQSRDQADRIEEAHAALRAAQAGATG